MDTMMGLEDGDGGGSRVAGLGPGRDYGAMEPSSSTSAPIASSNIGFQLLKKHGWEEGTGLGVSQQGRLEPIEAHVKKNKRGLGADKAKKVGEKPKHADNPTDDNKEKVRRENAGLSKKMRKMQEIEKRLKEKEFDRAFYREFWPDNV